MGRPLPYVAAEGCVTLTVRLTPNASKSSAAGSVELPDGRCALSVRVAAPPVDGAANAALIAVLSKSLGVRKAGVTIVSGETSRLKRMRIEGDERRIVASIQALLEPR
jgi:uncharacterized protein